MSNLNLSNLDLEGSKLIGVVACDTNFSESNLKNADLSSFYGIMVNFKKAILSGIKFNTYINNKEDINNEDINKLIPQSARKRNSSITRSNFELSDLKGVDLINVSLEQSVMSQAEVDENTVFNDDTIMEGAKIHGIDINKARFNEKINLSNTLMDNEQKNLLASKGINVTNAIVINENKDIVEPKQELLQETSSQKLEKEENNKNIEQQSQIQQEQTQTQPRIKPELKTHTQELEESRQAQVTSQINTDAFELEEPNRLKELENKMKQVGQLSFRENLELSKLRVKLQQQNNGNARAK